MQDLFFCRVGWDGTLHVPNVAKHNKKKFYVAKHNKKKFYVDTT